MVGERLITALELLGADPPARAAAAQMASTVALLDRLDPDAVYPIARRGPLFALSLGLLSVALGLAVLQGGPPDLPRCRPDGCRT